jgi:hypothetical protein
MGVVERLADEFGHLHAEWLPLARLSERGAGVCGSLMKTSSLLAPIVCS